MHGTVCTRIGRWIMFSLPLLGILASGCRGREEKPPVLAAASSKPSEDQEKPAAERTATPLPPDVEAAWRKAGAKIGWMAWDDLAGDSVFREKSEEGRAGQLPAFVFNTIEPGVLSKLPAPQAPFGLYLGLVAGSTNAVLVELPRFRNLQGLRLLYANNLHPLVGLGQIKQLKALYLASNVLDPALEEVDQLTQLEELHLGATDVTDQGVKKLARLKKLRRLSLWGVKQVTDAGLKELAGLKQLQCLDLYGTQTTDAGLKELSGLMQLQELRLNETRVTGVGLKDLVGLRQLQRLDLRSTQVSDAGMKQVGEFKQLHELKLAGTQVTDSGLKELAGLKQLKILWLDQTQVTDEGLKELAQMTQLEYLSLDKTPVTDAGLKHLAEIGRASCRERV